jgi:mono/diheme cytochrome c family protein
MRTRRAIFGWGGVLLALLFLANLARSSSSSAEEEEWKAPARAARKKNPVSADDSSIAAGKVLYTQHCLPCHGPAGKGDGPAAKDLNPKPHDLGDKKVVDQTDGALFWKLTEGRKPMPTFEKLIDENGRWQVVNYVRTLAPKADDKKP